MSDENGSEIPEKTSAEIAAELKSIKTLRIAGLVTFLCGIAIIIGVMVVSLALNLVKIHPFVILPIVFGISAVGATCMSRKCPKCGKPFYGMPIRFFWAHSCMHCKLSYKDDIQE